MTAVAELILEIAGTALGIMGWIIANLFISFFIFTIFEVTTNEWQEVRHE